MDCGLQYPSAFVEIPVMGECVVNIWPNPHDRSLISATNARRKTGELLSVPPFTNLPGTRFDRAALKALL